MVTKQGIQQEALNIWRTKGKGTFVMATGTGKTKLSLMIVEYLYKLVPNFKCLYICSRTIARDFNVPKEIEKHGYQEMAHCLTVECINTVYKWRQVDFDLVILDEVHNYMGPEFFSVFFKIRYKWIAAFTAYVDPVHLEKLNKVCPVIYELPLEKAVSLGVISDYKIINIEVPLTGQEELNYNLYQQRLDPIEREVSEVYGMNMRTFISLYRSVQGSPTYGVQSKEKNMAFNYNKLVSSRNSIIANFNQKKLTARNILNSFSDRQAIVFCPSIKCAVEMQELLGNDSRAYHSKIQSKKLKSQIIDDFSNKKLKYLLAINAIDEILDIPDLSLSITLTPTSVKRKAIQRKGRVRSLGGKLGLSINLYCPNTQDAVWLRNSLSEFSIEHIDHFTSVGSFLESSYVKA